MVRRELGTSLGSEFPSSVKHKRRAKLKMLGNLEPADGIFACLGLFSNQLAGMIVVADAGLFITDVSRTPMSAALVGARPFADSTGSD